AAEHPAEQRRRRQRQAQHEHDDQRQPEAVSVPFALHCLLLPWGLSGHCMTAGTMAERREPSYGTHGFSDTSCASFSLLPASSSAWAVSLVISPLASSSVASHSAKFDRSDFASLPLTVTFFAVPLS